MRDGVPSTHFGGQPRVFDYDFQSKTFTEVTRCAANEPAVVRDIRLSSDGPNLDQASPSDGFKASWRRLTFRLAQRTSIVPK